MATLRMAKKAIFALCFLFLLFNFSQARSMENDWAKNPGNSTTKTKLTLQSPVRIALGAGNKIYVTDYQKKIVAILRKNRKRVRLLNEFPVNGNPLGVAIDHESNIYVGNNSTNRVEVYGKNLRFRYLFEGEIKRPNDIATSASGLIYVVASDENTVKVFRPDGTYKFSIGSEGTGNGQFDFPTGIAVDDRNQEILVSDFMNKRVQIFDYEGTWLKTIGGGWFGSVIDRPQGIAVDEQDRIFVADPKQGCILVFSHAGDLLKMIGEYGREAGQLRIPLDVIVDHQGDILVTSNQNSRIEIFNGSF